MDVAYRRLLRSVVGPPRNMDWTLPWQEALRIWDERVQVFTLQAASKSWSELCLRHHWNVAQYFATLPGNRWNKKILAWQPAGHKRVGQPQYSWDTLLTNLCRLSPPNNRRCGRPPFAWDEKVRAVFRWKQLGAWKETSTETWHRFESEFVAFITGR